MPPGKVAVKGFRQPEPTDQLFSGIKVDLNQRTLRNVADAQRPGVGLAKTAGPRVNRSMHERQRQRRKVLLQEQKSHVESTRKRLSELRHEHQSKLLALRREQMATQRKMLHAKHEIEKQLIENASAAQRAYLATMQELQVSLDGRLKDLG